MSEQTNDYSNMLLSIESKTFVKGRKGKGKRRKGREKIPVESLQETLLGLTREIIQVWIQRGLAEMIVDCLQSS